MTHWRWLPALLISLSLLGACTRQDDEPLTLGDATPEPPPLNVSDTDEGVGEDGADELRQARQRLELAFWPLWLQPALAHVDTFDARMAPLRQIACDQGSMLQLGGQTPLILDFSGCWLQGIRYDGRVSLTPQPRPGEYALHSDSWQLRVSGRFFGLSGTVFLLDDDSAAWPQRRLRAEALQLNLADLALQLNAFSAQLRQEAGQYHYSAEATVNDPRDFAGTLSTGADWQWQAGEWPTGGEMTLRHDDQSAWYLNADSRDPGRLLTLVRYSAGGAIISGDLNWLDFQLPLPLSLF